MSDIARNCSRYGTGNTKRSDFPNPHNGEAIQKNIIGFDCSGFVCHVLIESGYRVDYESTHGLLKSKAFSDVTSEKVKPGDIILFNGHVGVVIDYDHANSLGKFIHMSGQKNRGEIKTSYFITDPTNFSVMFKQQHVPIDPDGKRITYGYTRPIEAFRRVNNNRYSAELDLHINGRNPFPTLHPLGTRVYSNHKVKRPKPLPTPAVKLHTPSLYNEKARKGTMRKVNYGAEILHNLYGRYQSVRNHVRVPDSKGHKP